MSLLENMINKKKGGGEEGREKICIFIPYGLSGLSQEE